MAQSDWRYAEQLHEASARIPNNKMQSLGDNPNEQPAPAMTPDLSAHTPMMQQ